MKRRMNAILASGSGDREFVPGDLSREIIKVTCCVY